MNQSPHKKSSVLVWLGVVAAALLTAAGAMLIVRTAPVGPQRSASAISADGATGQAALEPARPGVHATIRAGGITVQRQFPAMAFALEPGQTLDSRLPAGPFEAEFEVRFEPGDVRHAQIGAEFQGGAVLVRKGDSPLVSNYSKSAGKVVLSDSMIWAPRAYGVTFKFTSDGDSPARLRALWKPDQSLVPLPLPCNGAGWLDEATTRGRSLVQQLNCVACHASERESLQRDLHVNPAPIIGRVGQRVRADWIRAWLADPQALKPGAGMPSLFHGSEFDRADIENLVHFLVSLGGPIEDDPHAADPNLIVTGAVAYDRIGCVACHGPIDLPESGADHSSAGLQRSYVPLGPLRAKTTAKQLAKFLHDPVALRPNGRMPSQALDDLEAQSIAEFLIDRTGSLGDSADERGTVFIPDPDAAARGRALFAEVGCAACHSMGEGREAIVSTRRARSLESISAALAADESVRSGCLALTPQRGAPHFGLAEDKCRPIVAYLRTLPHRASDDVPLDTLSSTILRLNCIACHEIHGEGGPEPAIARHFKTNGETDLGDEGRLPPDLGFVGEKLRPDWIRMVLEEAGRARPYLAARMPQFGPANIHHMPAVLAAMDGQTVNPQDGPAFTAEDAAAGRKLVGSAGLNCIQCHGIAGRPATGTPGPDLTQMVQRLRYDRFFAWVSDPKLTRRWTRMPSFFVDGHSGTTDVLDGEARRQIPAIWSYLSQGQMLSLPEGMADPSSLELVVGDEPIVFRTFMHDAGVRAIACGFPEHIHYAFDPDRCTLALVWTGSFLNASGAWAQRGGSETNPTSVVWRAPKGPAFAIQRAAGQPAQPATVRFRGYQLDRQRRPSFQYDLSAADMLIKVTEQPVPKRDGGKESLLRTFTIEGPASAIVTIIGGKSTAEAGQIVLGDDGHATSQIEVTW